MTEIQTIRLFRGKESDIWSVFLLEFFKLIGCIVYDCVWPVKDEDLKSVFTETFDVNILWNLPSDQEQELREQADKEKNNGDECEAIRLIPVNGIKNTQENVPEQDLFVFSDSNCSRYLHQLINHIWPEHERESIYALSDAYIAAHLFFYCYNKGNLKFVQEYYPSYGNDGRIAEKRKTVSLMIYNQYAACYNELMEFAGNKTDLPYYYKYALVNIRYELNSIRSLGADRTIFYTDQLLKQAEQIKKENPNAIRIHFLVAKICRADDSYLWDAEFHFIRSINKFVSQYQGCKAGDFLYYQFAKYYEKDRKENDKAGEYYQKAVEVNPRAYRAIYKLAKWEEQKGNYAACSNLANNIIHIVLNGYKIKQLMPKQQIYIYKCYRLLGDVFVHAEAYDLALKSYQRALIVADAEVDFFGSEMCLKNGAAAADHKNQSEIREFQKIVMACMPKLPVYSKIISSASKIRNMDLVDYYQEQMLKGELADESGNRTIKTE